MIVVVGRVVAGPGKRDELIALGQKVAGASREEAGCLNYNLFEDTETPDAFVIVEEWASEEALQEHFGTPHTAEFMAAFPGTLGGIPDVRFHTIERSRDLSEIAAR